MAKKKKSSQPKKEADVAQPYSEQEYLSNSEFRAKSKKIGEKFYPIVSVCTPTFNRRPFIPMMFECFKNQEYPKSAIEWIIVDDGTDSIEDLIKTSNIENIKYYRLSKKIPLGEKRNFMHTKSNGSIIVYMDDDDYYPPERISHAVERLQENKDALCAGASEIYIYYKHISKMIQCGPYGPNHATAGTFAFRSELLKQTKYDNTAALAEEKSFLKNYTVPFVQLDPLKTILVFSHNQNTFDKRKMLENMHPQYCKESPKKVADFIRRDNEGSMYTFFLRDIDNLLANYEAGEPKMKPDVLENIKKLEKERTETKKNMELQQQMNPNQGGCNPGGTKIMFARPGEQPQEIPPEQIIAILQQMNTEIQKLNTQIAEKDEIIRDLMKKQLIKEHTMENVVEHPVFLQNTMSSSENIPLIKSEPVVKISI